jgi:hypothetical protein
MVCGRRDDAEEGQLKETRRPKKSKMKMMKTVGSAGHRAGPVFYSKLGGVA